MDLKHAYNLAIIPSEKFPVNDLNDGYEGKRVGERGGLGDGTTKKILEECLQELLRPIRAKRAELLGDKAQLIDILAKGSRVSKEKTEKVLFDIKSIFGLNIL